VNLRDHLAEVAAGLPDIGATTGPGGAVTWSRAGRPFAALSGEMALGDDAVAVEFDLEPVVAAAAARTPDVATSGRGPGWVTFRPALLDAHAADRAAAWFASAHRRVSHG
jgi:hypothetical protein